MNKIQTFQQFLATQNMMIPVLEFSLNLFLAAVLSFILGRIYLIYGTSLSNRRMFARNFMLITMTTMLIIALIKSSLALSLGLVGALSIVRFRAAIKEPEELAYLFLAIAIGLGLGANQRVIILIGFFIICGIIMLRNRYSSSKNYQNLYLTVSSRNPQKITLEQIVEILKECCPAVNMKRFDETKEVLEASFFVEFDNIKQLQLFKSKLQKLNDSVNITFLDNKGVF